VRTRVLAWVAALLTVEVVAMTLAAPHRLLKDAPAANLVIQTTAALVGLLVAVVAFGRFRQRRRVTDLLLVLGLAQLAAGNLAFTLLPLVADAEHVSSRMVWAASLSRLAGSLLLVAAAHVTGGPVDETRAYADEMVVAVGTGVLAAIAFGAASRLPEITATGPAHRLWESAPGLTAVLAASAIAAAVAAVGFVRSHTREPDDELPGWLALASIAASGAYAATALTFLSTYSPYVATAELLKLTCSLLLLGGVLREMRGYWRDRAMAAVANERRRIARDLHDGLAQELAYLVTRSRVLARRGNEDLWDICSAAERALDESRRAIAALTRDDDEPLDLALAQTAHEVGERLGTRVTLELDHLDVATESKEALLRIAREAITNAARHGAATRVHVRLSGDGGVRMRVSDNGRGFDASAPPAPGRLGLTNIRERATALGGAVTVASRRPGGTDVEVVLP
jgi:signal transduction histidine kinase